MAGIVLFALGCNIFNMGVIQGQPLYEMYNGVEYIF